MLLNQPSMSALIAFSIFSICLVSSSSQVHHELKDTVTYSGDHKQEEKAQKPSLKHSADDEIESVIVDPINMEESQLSQVSQDILISGSEAVGVNKNQERLQKKSERLKKPSENSTLPQKDPDDTADGDDSTNSSASAPESTSKQTCLCNDEEKSCLDCCCSSDCSQKENSGICKRRFHKSESREQKLCTSRYDVSPDSVGNQIIEENTGLFCVHRDNGPSEKLSQPNKEGIKAYMSQKLKPKFYPGQDTERELEVFTYKEEPYVYRSFIWGVIPVSGNIEKTAALAVPFALYGGLCSVFQPILYLQPLDHKCEVSLGQNLASSCESTPFLNANEVMVLSAVYGDPSERENIIYFSKRVCLTELENSEKKCQDLDISSSLPSPKLIEGDGELICQNALQQMDLIIFHNLTDGIKSLHVEYHLFNLKQTEKRQSLRVSQKYSVSYHCVCSKGQLDDKKYPTSVHYPKSGSPGYEISKPVIMGRKIDYEDPIEAGTTIVPEADQDYPSDQKDKGRLKKEKPEKIIFLTPYPRDWMSMISSGFCETGNEHLRTPVRFGYDSQATCKLHIGVQKYCSELAIRIAGILFQPQFALNFELGEWHVAQFGDSNPLKIKEWVKVEYQNFPILLEPEKSSKRLIEHGCTDLITSVHITVIHASIGYVGSPQAKIYGVLYKLGEPVDIPDRRKCVKTNISCTYQFIELSSTVTFIDVTEKPVTKYGTWPSISVHLPKDFFYPFSSLSKAYSSATASFSSTSFLSVFISAATVKVILEFNYN